LTERRRLGKIAAKGRWRRFSGAPDTNIRHASLSGRSRTSGNISVRTGSQTPSRKLRRHRRRRMRCLAKADRRSRGSHPSACETGPTSVSYYDLWYLSVARASIASLGFPERGMSQTVASDQRLAGRHDGRRLNAPSRWLRRPTFIRRARRRDALRTGRSRRFYRPPISSVKRSSISPARAFASSIEISLGRSLSVEGCSRNLPINA
jgi:hypothetical protein